MIKAIVFDFDGVIADTYDYNFNIFSKINKNLDHETFKAHHDSNVYENPKVEFKNGDIEKFFKEYFDNIQTIDAIIEDEILKKLSEKYNLYIISSNFEKNINRFLESKSLNSYFTKILGVETHKSKVEKFKILFNETCLIKENFNFITDTLGDVLEGNKAGVKTVAVDFGYHERERLEKGQPFRIISSFEELEEILSNYVICKSLSI